MGVLERFVLILFHTFVGNPIQCEFFRNLRILLLSIVTWEKSQKQLGRLSTVSSEYSIVNAEKVRERCQIAPAYL